MVAGAAALREKYPALDNIVAESFEGQLSNRDERIVVLDAQGNVADEVHYYDSGRWPAYADGGGSSLELRDALADNNRAESWQASDESDDAPWQTITYRGIVERDGYTNGVTNLYQEFILGLLDAGEVLIDDISVVEDPAGAAIQRIQNGTFEEDGLGGEP